MCSLQNNNDKKKHPYILVTKLSVRDIQDIIHQGIIASLKLKEKEKKKKKT